jgi:hypothetical protein
MIPKPNDGLVTESGSTTFSGSKKNLLAQNIEVSGGLLIMTKMSQSAALMAVSPTDGFNMAVNETESQSI